MLACFALDVSHFQFYVEDINSEADTGHIWDNALERPDNYALGTLPNTVAVGTLRYGGAVAVEVEILEQRPTIAYTEWDYVVECSLNVPSGSIRTYGCLSNPNTDPTIDLTPGTYSMIVYYGGADTIDENDGAGLTGNDHYRVTLWPGTYTEPRVLK